MKQINQMKHRFLSALMAALILLAGGFVSVATASSGSGSIIAATLASNNAGGAMLLTAKADLDRGGILSQGEGNGFWGQLSKNINTEGSMAAIGSSHVAYAGLMQNGDCRSINALIAATQGIAVQKIIG